MAEIENLKIYGSATYTVGNQDIIANAWEAGITYVKGKSYVIREHKLYVCNVTHTSVEPFDPTNWTEITIGDAIGNNIGDLSSLTTTDKSSLVGAVNEVNGVMSDVTLTTKTHCKYRKCQNGVVVLYIDGATDGEQLDIPTPANIGYYVGLNQSNNPTAFALKTTRALQLYGTGTSLYATIVYAATTN